MSQASPAPQEHDRYPYSAIVDRPPLRWPNGARVAVWVIPNIVSLRICAACDTVSSHAKIEAAVTMNSTEAVVSMVSNVAFATVCSVIER